MNKQIIGLAGTNGSGKDTVGQILAEKYGWLFISGSDMLREELSRRGLPPAREHMRALSAEWRREKGLGVIIDKVVEAYKQQGGDGKFQGLVTVSLRNPGEVDRVHELGGIVVWVDADPRIRYERLQANAVNRGELRAVDDQKTFEQFLADEEAEMHRPAQGDDAMLNMSAVKEKCDIFIENNGNDIAAFQHDIEKALGLSSS